MLSDRNRNPLRVTVQAILGVVSCSAAAGAWAQQSSPAQESLEEVVVTGFRESLSLALDQKRAAVGSIDAIVAEDIADFPDLNLAESIQRVPGVSIARDGGEGRQISVRGLGPQFTRVRINGMEAMSANGGTDAAGGTNRDRSFDFNTFASELFNSVTIRKSSAAEIEEGSLGATVDLRSAHPFDYDGFTVVTSVQGSYNDISEDVDPRGALLISNTFADGKFGALISAAYTKRKLLDEGASTVRWQDSRNTDGTRVAGRGVQHHATGRGRRADAGPDECGIPSAHPALRHLRARAGASRHHRLAAVAGLGQHADQPRRHVCQLQGGAQRDLSRGAGLQRHRRHQHEPGRRGRCGDRFDSNTIVYGVFNDVDVRSEARFDELETDFTHLTLDAEPQLLRHLAAAWTGRIFRSRA